MDGLTILNEVTKYTEVYSGWIWVFIVFAIICVFVAIEEESFLLGFVVSAIIAVILAFNPVSKIPYQEYKVTISDNVQFTDFTSKYDVIEQEGKIYTVKLK